MKKYNTPIADLVEFETADIITQSDIVNVGTAGLSWFSKDRYDDKQDVEELDWFTKNN